MVCLGFTTEFVEVHQLLFSGPKLLSLGENGGQNGMKQKDDNHAKQANH